VKSRGAGGEGSVLVGHSLTILTQGEQDWGRGPHLIINWKGCSRRKCEKVIEALKGLKVDRLGWAGKGGTQGPREQGSVSSSLSTCRKDGTEGYL